MIQPLILCLVWIVLLARGVADISSSNEACALKTFSTTTHKSKESKSKSENGGSGAIENLANLAIPVPSNRYNATQAERQHWIYEGWQVMRMELDFWCGMIFGFNTSLKDLQANYTSGPSWYTDFAAWPNDSVPINTTFNPETPNKTYPINVTNFIVEDLDWFGKAAFPSPCNTDDMSRFGTMNFLPDWEKAKQNNSAKDDRGSVLYNLLFDKYDNTKDQMDQAYFRIIGAYMGVGWHPSCIKPINQVLEDASGWDKAGASVATTLMALIPTLPTFGNLFVPRSSEVFGTSLLVGIMSALFSFGLPVRSVSGFSASRKKQHIDVGKFGVVAKDKIHTYGKCKKPRPEDDTDRDSFRQRAETFISLEDLQKWSDKPLKDEDINNSIVTITLHRVGNDLNVFPQEVKLAINKQMETQSKQHEASEKSFWSIKNQAMKWRKRAHFWHVPAFVICCLQAALFIGAIGPLFLGFGTPLLLFDCRTVWTSIWLLVSAGVSAVFRLLLWEKGSHERVRIWDLSDTAKEKLTKLFINVDQESVYYGNGDRGMLNTTETELPPLYAPLERRIRFIIRRFWHRILYVSRTKRGSQSDDGKFLRDAVRHQARLWLARILWPITNRRNFIRAGYEGTQWLHWRDLEKWKTQLSGVPVSARRYRPLIILMYLSLAGRNPLATLFTGLVEGLVLILLTIFLGSQWGGNLFVVCYTILVLLIVVTAGRALGLWYVLQSTSTWGLHVLECETPRDIQGCLRIICSMKGALVFVNGAYYFEGYRLDVRDGWSSWIVEYEKGMYDSDKTITPKSSTLGLSQESTASLLSETSRQPSSATHVTAAPASQYEPRHKLSDAADIPLNELRDNINPKVGSSTTLSAGRRPSASSFA